MVAAIADDRRWHYSIDRCEYNPPCGSKSRRLKDSRVQIPFTGTRGRAVCWNNSRKLDRPHAYAAVTPSALLYQSWSLKAGRRIERKLPVPLTIETTMRTEYTPASDDGPTVNHSRSSHLLRARGRPRRRIYDVGQSGRRSPPELNKLVEDARKRLFDAIVVWRFDRFARSTNICLGAGDSVLASSYLLPREIDHQ